MLDMQAGLQAQVQSLNARVKTLERELKQVRDQAAAREAVMVEAAQLCYDALPDSTLGDDWQNAWEALNADSQEQVKRARKRIWAALAGASERATLLLKLVGEGPGVRSAHCHEDDECPFCLLLAEWEAC